MHSGGVVVRPNGVAIIDVLVEIVRVSRPNVFQMSNDEQIAILSRLLVPQPYCMTDFMNYRSFTLKAASDALLTSLLADGA